ncbi:response regulator transcription factor [Sphingomonas kaistensis]|uniref:Response regulator transcription factor n=1 Tax=Sphingomonas kaistensis TaxID=298708 RepID=A0ABZ2G521_9SPHN
MTQVLIVDDHPLMRDGLRSLISAGFDDCTVHEASSIAEALDCMNRADDLDFVLLDLHVPDASAFDGLTRIRDHHPAVPVIMVSAATDRQNIRGALDAGASGFIVKSMKRSAIISAVNAVLSGDVYVPDELHAPDAVDQERDTILAKIASLTPQQTVVLGLIVAGKLNKQIAFDLDVSMTTVKAHVSAILAKLNVFSRTQAVILSNKVGFPGNASPHGHH